MSSFVRMLRPAYMAANDFCHRRIGQIKQVLRVKAAINTMVVAKHNCRLDPHAHLASGAVSYVAVKHLRPNSIVVGVPAKAFKSPYLDTPR